MTPRTEQILEALIQEFIATGEPVSSNQLVRKRDFRVKDATIRNELNYLMHEGYLEQPHVSSGRIPTDKGYRFFVHVAMAEIAEMPSVSYKKTLGVLENEFNRGDFHDFIDDVADELEVLGIGYLSAEDELHKSGLDDLFANLVTDREFSDSRDMFQVVKDFEMIDERVGDLLNFLTPGGEPKVFVGKSPITKSKCLSVIADQYDIDGEKFILAAVGPKRMDYGRNIRFFKTLRQAINT